MLRLAPTPAGSPQLSLTHSFHMKIIFVGVSTIQNGLSRCSLQIQMQGYSTSSHLLQEYLSCISLIIPFSLLATSSLLVHTANIPCRTKSQAGFWQEQLHLCAGALNTLLHSLLIGGNKVKSSPSVLEGDPANLLESVSVTINSA